MPRLSSLRRRQRDDAMFDDLRLSADETRSMFRSAPIRQSFANAGCGGRKRAIVRHVATWRYHVAVPTVATMEPLHVSDGFFARTPLTAAVSKQDSGPRCC